MTDSLPGRHGYGGSKLPLVPAQYTHDSQSLIHSLDDDVMFYRSNTFAASTSRTYLAHKVAYFEFYNKISVKPVPLSQYDLGRYIAYLSRRLCFSSVRQYLNIVRLLHVEAGFGNPLENNWYVSSILKGVKRVKGDTSSQKLPITLDILKQVFVNLNLNGSMDRHFGLLAL